MRTPFLWSAVCALSGLLAACRVAAPVPTAVVASRPLPIDSHSRNSVAFVRGHIGDSGPYWFLLDTGASRSALDREVARSLGLKSIARSRVEGSAGTIDVQTTRLPPLRLGGVVIEGLEPTVYDLSGSLAPEGANIAGILGHDLLDDFALLIEPRSGRVALAADSEAFGPVADAVVVPFSLDNNIPVVEAAIDGVPVRLRLDTGASIGPGPTIFVNVTQAQFDRLSAADPSLRPYTHFTASGTGGETRLPVVRARRLELGGLWLGQPHLIVQPRAGYFARPDAIGFLGTYSLQGVARFVVDYRRRRLLLYP